MASLFNLVYCLWGKPGVFLGFYNEKVPGLAHKQYTSLERLAMDKHSSLLQKSIPYCCKKFYKIGPSVGFSLAYKY
jgi:hypothetical protein